MMKLKKLLDKNYEIEFNVSIYSDEHNNIIMSIGGNDNSGCDYQINKKQDIINAFKDYLNYEGVIE